MRQLCVLLCLPLALGCAEASRPPSQPAASGQARPERVGSWEPAPVPRVGEPRRMAPFPPRNPFITGSDLVPVRRR